MPPPTAPIERPSPAVQRAPVQHGTARLYLPGAAGPRQVRYQVVDGMAIHQGDILLGHVSQLGLRYGRPRQAAQPGVSHATAIGSELNDHLWPGAVMPYVVDPSLSGSDQNDLAAAIERVNQTTLKLRPATAADADHLVFVNRGRGCYSYYGRIGGPQDVHVGGCGSSTMIHEILHAAGFYHEHSRPDRDQYISVMWEEIVDGEQSNFEINEGARVYGAYDFQSIMHYSERAFSKRGQKTIVSKVQGVTVGGASDMSPTDIAGINELYGSAPGGVPPGVVPPGLIPPGLIPPGLIPPGTIPPGTSLPDLFGVPPNQLLPGLPPLPQELPPLPNVFW